MASRVGKLDVVMWSRSRSEDGIDLWWWAGGVNFSLGDAQSGVGVPSGCVGG